MTDSSTRVVKFGYGKLTHDAFGVEHLARLARDLINLPADKLFVDMSRQQWFDAHLTAPLAVIVQHAINRGKSVRFDAEKIPDKIYENLCRNKFLLEDAKDNFETTLPLEKFKTAEAVEFSAYAKKYLTRKEAPKMGKRLKQRFFEGVDEIFANASLHAKTETPICVSGQFFPGQNRLDIAIADGGRGIQRGILDALGIRMEADAAIDWAMTPNNTTRQLDIPGGLGSEIVRQFIRINGGKLVVASHGGLWIQAADTVTMTKLPCPFPGTMVILEIDTSDDRAYDLAAAPDPRDIW